VVANPAAVVVVTKIAIEKKKKRTVAIPPFLCFWLLYKRSSFLGSPDRGGGAGSHTLDNTNHIAGELGIGNYLTGTGIKSFAAGFEVGMGTEGEHGERASMSFANGGLPVKSGVNVDDHQAMLALFKMLLKSMESAGGCHVPSMMAKRIMNFHGEEEIFLQGENGGGHGRINLFSWD
jgi:hypothetical protein